MKITIFVLLLFVLFRFGDSFHVNTRIKSLFKIYSNDKPDINNFFYKPPPFSLNIKTIEESKVDIKEEKTNKQQQQRQQQQQGNPIESFISTLFPSKTSKQENNNNNNNEILLINNEITIVRDLLVKASNKEIEDTNSIVESLLKLEKLMRKKNILDENITSEETLKSLNGSWKLIFTTGTVDTQKKIGRINYFPLKAVQSFDTSENPYKISNGIFINDFALLKFFGNFSWNLKSRKLEFDFDEISIAGLRFQLPSGGARKIGSSTGLGSENNTKIPTPFFNWISADEEIATARGGGGGLALWRRVQLTET